MRLRGLRVFATATTMILVAASSSMPAAASDRNACGPISGTYQLPAPPPGLVSVEDLTVEANCFVQRGPVRYVPGTDLRSSSNDMAAAIFGSVAESASTTQVVATNGSGSGCCWAGYAVQRTWDIAGLELNEYWTEFTFNTCSGGICSPYLRTWWAQDGGKWHTEIGNPGWYPNYGDRWLYRTSGGVGYTWVSVEGHQGYHYKGLFDLGGNDYYNSYTNDLTGSTIGIWTCSYAYYWKKSFVGWHTQSWCGSGPYPYK
jgi:hypothetical protein